MPPPALSPFPQPTDLPALFAYISASPPYATINHKTTPFLIDLADFLQYELESALRFGISTFKHTKSKLEEALISALQRPEAPDYSDVVDLLKQITMGPIEEINEKRYNQLIVKSKYTGDFGYENCFVGLAKGIQRMEVELRLLGREVVKTPQEDRNEDDWFVVGRVLPECKEEKDEDPNRGREGSIEVRLEVYD